MGKWLGSLGMLILLVAGLATYAGRPPVYAVWLNGRSIGTGRDLPEIAAKVADTLEQQRTRTVTLSAGEQRWEFRLADLGMTTPPVQDAIALALKDVDRSSRLPWKQAVVRVSLQPDWDAERLEMALLPVKAALARAPVPAKLEIRNETPVITPEVMGAAVDTDGLEAALVAHPEADRLTVPVAPQAPAVTQKSLEAMRIKKLVAEWSTRYDPAIPRGENVARAAKAFNGLILKPGEILSYNATVGPVDAANGWKEAFVIENGRLVPGIGGGVCQVATTFYGAALRANLEILERHQHDLAVTYIDPSQDAAIAQDYQDLKLRNTTLGHLLIQTEAEDGAVTFRLYGDVREGQEVKIESRVLSTTPYPVQKVKDAGLAPGQTVVKNHGNSGYTSEAYRLVYQDGTLLKKEKLSRDSYLPTTEVVAVGG
ncbi:MAG TPA: VanW family protein [Symbiobacteriaceae bacterium]|jgi:vancomycin resistance protein YoaR